MRIHLRSLIASYVAIAFCWLAVVATADPPPPVAESAPRPSAPRKIEAADALLTIAEEVDVSAATAGVLVELRAREGAMLKQGEPLLRVDDRRAELAVSQAFVELQRAKDEAETEVAKRHAAKAKELADSEHQRALAIDAASPSSVSDRELDRLRLAAEVAGLEVETAAHRQKLTRYDLRLKQEAYRVVEQELAEHRVAAPLAGLVVRVHKRPGEWVDRGEPVVTIVRVDRLRAEMVLPVAEATLDLTGSPAEFTTPSASGEAVTAKGRVVFVSPRADPVTALARVWVELPVTDRRLRPGLRGAVRIFPSKVSAPPTRAVSLSEAPDAKLD